jgi:flagellar biosynthesis/type III secretory pathway chaperone
MNQNPSSPPTALKPEWAPQSKSTAGITSHHSESHQAELQRAELYQAVSAMLVHLRRESEFLDSVIECSLKMKDLLRRRTVSDSNPNEKGQPQDQLDSLRDDLARQFLPIRDGRQQMEATLQGFSTMVSEPPTISRLAPNLDEPFRTQLKQLKTEIKSKLHHVQAITMGNQAVLIYTMDHYQRLFNGMSGDRVTSNKAYNASGRMTNQTIAHTLRKNC